MADDNTLPPMGDDMGSNAGPSEQELLDAVMANSPIMDEVAPPLPVEEEIVEDPEEVAEVDDPEATESEADDEEGYEEEVEEAEDEDGAEAPTQEADVYTADDLDLEAKVIVKVDGEEQEVSFGDLLKGYQTDSHLSKKGRELGEAQKALEAERAEKLEELDKVATASAVMLSASEERLAKEYHDLESKIKEARDSGDTFELGELKDKREQVQQNYWNARKQREGLLEAVDKHRAEQQQAQLQEQIQHFQNEIPNMIPDFNDEVASKIREFAEAEGISGELLDSVVDPVVVKFIDDYRRLKQGVNKGVAKRKATPTKKAVPAKKAKTPQKKAQDKAAMTKARAFKENASEEDKMDFLRAYASKSLNL